MIIRGGRATLSKIQNRLILPMSILDMVQSIALGFSTMPIPKGSLCTYGSIGNKTTCTIQGFAIQLGFCVPCYNAMLSIYYLCTIKYKMSEDELAKYEPFMHTIAILPSVAAAIFATSFSLFNNISIVCFVEKSDRYLEKQVNSHHSDTLILIFYGILILMFAIVAICIIYCMISIFLFLEGKVKQMQSILNPDEVRRSRRNSTDGSRRMRSTIDSLVDDAKKQAYLYVGSCFITYSIPIAIVIVGIFLGEVQPFFLRVLQAIFQPLQGFWNLIIFIRPRYKSMRNEEPNKSMCEILHLAIFQNQRNSFNCAGITRAGKMSFPCKRRKKEYQETIPQREQEEKNDEEDEDGEDDIGPLSMISRRNEKEVLSSGERMMGKRLRQILDDLDDDIEHSHDIQMSTTTHNMNETAISNDTVLERGSIPDIVGIPLDDLRVSSSTETDNRQRNPVSSLFEPEGTETETSLL